MFRDGHSPHMVKEEPTSMYPSLANYAACNGPEGAVSPGAAAAAAVAAVAQGNDRLPYVCIRLSEKFLSFRDRRAGFSLLYYFAELRTIDLVLSLHLVSRLYEGGLS